MGVKTIAVVQEGVAPNREAEDSNERRNEDDCDGNFAGLPPAFGPWEAKTIQQEERPDEVELLLDAEGPEVLQ